VTNAASTSVGVEITHSGALASRALTVEHSGLGAGVDMQITNTASVNNVLQINNLGLGRGALIQSTNAANAQNILDVFTAGTGWAAQIQSSNATPRALRTAGGLRFTGINEALNRILASDALGNATWQDPSAIGVVTGSGTLNFVPKWTPNGTNLGNSQIFDNGTNLGIGTITPTAKLQVEQPAATGGAMIINKSNAANTSNGVNVFSLNNSNTSWGNSTVYGQRDNLTANTYLYVGGGLPTSMTAVSSGGIGLQATSENGMGMVGLVFNGIGIRGYNLNSGNAARFENDLNAGNVQPVVFVNSIATGGGVFGLHSNMAATTPGGYSTALRGEHNSTTGNGIGVWGSQNGAGWGVHGTTVRGVGVYGNASNGTGGAGFGVWGEAFGANAFSGGVFRGLTGSYYGSFTDNDNPAGFAAALAYQNNTNPTNLNSSAMWGLNLATNGVGFGARFSHASDGVGVYGVTGLNGTGVSGASSGVGSIGVQGASDLGYAGFFQTSNAASVNATLRANDPNLNGGSFFRKAAIYGEITTIVPGTLMLASTSAIKGVGSISPTLGNAGGTGVQGVSHSGYGVVGNTNDGSGLVGVAWGTGYGLRTQGRVQIIGQGAALNRVLTSDAIGNATWQDLSAIGGVSGSGTLNYVAKWTPDGVTVGISQLYDNGVSIGIGTTTPSPALLMDMRGTMAQLRLVDNDQASQVWLSAPGLGYTGGVGTLTNHDFPIFTNFTDRMTVKANGRVGVNTTNPQGTMEIFENSFVGTPHLMLNENGDDYGRLTLRNTNANNSGNNFWDIAGYTNDTRSFERLNFFNASNGDLMTITGDGRVGIGIQAFYPFTKLHVNSSGDYNNLLLEAQSVNQEGPHQYYYSGGEYGIIDYIRTDYAQPGLLYRRGALEVRGMSRLNLHATNAINPANGMTLLGDGLVGVGTDNPFYKFHIAANVAVNFVHDLDQGTAVALVAPGLGYTGGAGTFTAQDFPLFTSNIDRVTVKPNGDVGIATSTPQSRLHLIARPDSPGIMSEVGYTTPAGSTAQRFANSFNGLNTNYGILSKTGATININLPSMHTAVLGVDSTDATITAGVTGYAIGNNQGNTGVYGFGSLNASPTSIGYVGAVSGGTFFGGDVGATAAVWNSVPQLGSTGTLTDKFAFWAFVNTAPHLGTNYGIYSGNITGGATNYAGYFLGDVVVNGNFSATGAKAFKIDHPLDPANKYLVHAAVESPDMMNVYNGNVVTDASGKATVTLPSYFEAANKDFKYQLTIIDETDFAMARISKKISGNSFEIMTDKPNIEVSWQVTGVRKDPAADQFRFTAEQEKPASEKGKYLIPELYNQPQSMGIHQAPKTTLQNPTDQATYVPVTFKEPEPKKIPTSALESDPAAELKAREEMEKTWFKGQNTSIPTRNTSTADGIQAVPQKKSAMTEEMAPVEDKNKAKVQTDGKTETRVSPADKTLPAPRFESIALTQEEINTEKKQQEAKNSAKKPSGDTVPPVIPANATKGQVDENSGKIKPVVPEGKVEKQPVKE
jgi:hypothetical protein